MKKSRIRFVEPKSNPVTEMVILDWKQIQDESVVELQKALVPFGVHLGDAEKEYHGTAVSDTFILYVAKKKASRRALKGMLGMEDNE
jgi:hypothetical protein